MEPSDFFSGEDKKRIQKKKEKKQKKSVAPKEKTTSWAEMCESDYESDGEDLEEGHRWEDYESESDGEFAKVAPQLDDEEDEAESFLPKEPHKPEYLVGG